MGTPQKGTPTNFRKPSALYDPKYPYITATTGTPDILGKTDNVEPPRQAASHVTSSFGQKDANWPLAQLILRLTGGL